MDLLKKGYKILREEGFKNFIIKFSKFFRNKFSYIQSEEEFFYGIDNNLLEKEYFEIGEGNVLYIKGWCFHSKYLVKKLEIMIGNYIYKIQNYGLLRFDIFNNFKNYNYYNSLNSGFFSVIPIKNFAEGIKDIYLLAYFKNNIVIKVKIHSIYFIKRMLYENTKLVLERINKIKKKYPNDKFVIICMTTYNPNIRLFENQINSIRNQSYRNWLCIINDDYSDINLYEKVNNLIKDDERFIFFRNNKRMGFYYNFEQVLKYVPYKEVDYVALSDQDDYWYSNKIEKSISQFNYNTSLVYCDMKIVNINGKILFSTYWVTRKNYYSDLDFLILANTITGAASIFRADLLKIILPFPERVGDSFHDHWIACVANILGDIKYINEPLYNYYQHIDNLLGHFKFDSKVKKIKKFFKNLKNLKNYLLNYQNIYLNDGLRLIIIANCLNLRIENLKLSKKRCLKRFIIFNKSSLGIFLIILKNIFLQKSTDNAEIRLFCSFIINKFINFYGKLKYFIIKMTIKNENLKFYKTSYEFIKSKIEPLKLKIDNNKFQYINMLIPSIDFKYFFGGYIAKFNLAKKLFKSGYKVRIILVDQNYINLDYCRKEIKDYEGLEDIFDNIEIVPLFNRNKMINVSSKDIFIATTWWTAYIANDAVLKINSNRFIYFIQEYEPFTFPRGSFYELANNSYNFPHFAIFSTEFLQEFFKINKIGVYRKGNEYGNKDSVVFRNPVKKINIDINDIKRKDRKKLLFYARPESHASRNMFELGMLSLNKAIENKIFNIKDWDFYGIGSTINRNYKIFDNIYLKMIPKVSYNEYYKLLKKFDLGLCLMDTPHPSLPPIDMAACGLIVITSTCLNKTYSKLKMISHNIIGVNPTIEDILKGFKLGINLVDDYNYRLKGSNVNWTTSWDDAFNDNFMEKLKEFFLYINHKQNQ